MRAKKADNHWLVYFANELENSVLGEFKLEKKCSQSSHPFFLFFQLVYMTFDERLRIGLVAFIQSDLIQVL